MNVDSEVGVATGTILEGRVTRVTFHNPENGWTVMTVETARGERVKVVGPADATPLEGSNVRASGASHEHPKYGRQFAAESVGVRMPSDADGLASYLADCVPGLGHKFAHRITAKFGALTEEVLGDLGALRRVPGIGLKRAESIVKAWKEQAENRDALIFLRSIGLGPGMATRALRRFAGTDLETDLRRNPYRLIAVRGIGFKIADSAAHRLGIPRDSRDRIRAGVIFALETRSEKGHTTTYDIQLADEAAEILSLPRSRVEPEIGECELAGHIKARRDNGRTSYLLPRLDRAERSVAADILRLSGGRSEKKVPAPEEIRRLFGFLPDSSQMNAIQCALSSGLSVLTGGPGCGKTTITKAIARLFGGNVRLAAPTGRAAKRLAEATGMPAQTIHRLLGVEGGDGGFKFRYNGQNRLPLAGGLLIVDEVSMLDIRLAACLFDAIPDGAAVLLVGDSDQLPSVGPGNVLWDLISAGVPTTRLSRIYRQQDGSPIVYAAAAIVDGQVPKMPREGDCRLIPASSGDGSEVIAAVRELLAHGAISTDIQVLAPMRRGTYGSDLLNLSLQSALNASGFAKGGVSTGRHFGFGENATPEILCAGDRVMQTANNYGLNLYNGDMLTVLEVPPPGSEERWVEALAEDADGQRQVRVEGADLRDLCLAYATTVHKAQGGQYPHVILALTAQHYVMLARRLLYTAITRAQKSLTVIGDAKTIAMAVRNVGGDGPMRHTGLVGLVQTMVAGAA